MAAEVLAEVAVLALVAWVEERERDFVLVDEELLRTEVRLLETLLVVDTLTLLESYLFKVA